VLLILHLPGILGDEFDNHFLFLPFQPNINRVLNRLRELLRLGERHRIVMIFKKLRREFKTFYVVHLPQRVIDQIIKIPLRDGSFIG
jgi:hypothetical protein